MAKLISLAHIEKVTGSVNLPLFHFNRYKNFNVSKISSNIVL